MKNFYLMVFVLILSSCVQRQPYTLQNQFIEADYQTFLEKGNSTIKGQVFGKTRGGDVKFGAGETVILLPRTPYTEEVVLANERFRNISNIDRRITQYSKKTTADGNGRFEFNNVPNGDYIVWSEVWWEFFNGHYMQKTGGDVTAAVSVSKEDTYNVVVTK